MRDALLKPYARSWINLRLISGLSATIFITKGVTTSPAMVTPNHHSEKSAPTSDFGISGGMMVGKVFRTTCNCCCGMDSAKIL